jgi:hypothetical protein
VELDRPFLQLPFLFDTEVLTAEVDRLVPENWLAHPSGLSGNTAVPLVSINGEPRDGFDGPMAATAVLQRSPYLLQVVSSFGEVVARSRLMRLAPGAEVQEHVDFNYHWYSRVRIHVPIVTEPTVRFFCGAEEVHMAAGEAWLFDSWRRHRVVNGSAKHRIHLVVDIAGSARFWGMVRRVQRADTVEAPQRLAFDESRESELRVERFPAAPIMAPGEMAAIVSELMSDCSANPNNNAEELEYYHDLLFDLVHDWRNHWSLYGFMEDGVSGYQALLKRTQAGLRPDPRVLVTQSNKVGINPIINQRLLAAALKPQRSKEFVTGGS